MAPRFARGLSRLRPVLPIAAISSILALVPYPTCLLRLVFGIPCPACGLTRAAIAAAHFDLAAAQRFNPLATALIAITAGMTAAAFTVTDAAWKRAVAIVTGAAGVALVAVWALRFAGLFGGPVP